MFVEAFAYAERDKLKFNPEDRLLAIYRAQYPSQWMADAMELETLDLLVRKRYEVSLSEIWNNDLTLGKLFEQCANK